jgi:uncharacterized protein (TIGR00725 family)
MKINIGVIGSRQTSDKNVKLAEELGREIAKSGAVLICGGRGGIMRAAAKGCKQAKGLSIGILPVLDKKDCDCEYLDVIMPTSLGYGRNIFIASASDVLIAIDGSYGTMSEVAFALNYGRPVVVMKGTGGTSDYLVGGPFEVSVAKSAKEAVALALKLAGRG